MEVLPEPAELGWLETSRCARCLAIFCAAASLGSIFCARSHHTVAFCFLIRATYEVGVLVAVDRPDVDRLGRPEFIDPTVGCRCIDMFMEAAEDWRECVG